MATFIPLEGATRTILPAHGQFSHEELVRLLGVRNTDAVIHYCRHHRQVDFGGTEPSGIFEAYGPIFIFNYSAKLGPDQINYQAWEATDWLIWGPAIIADPDEVPSEHRHLGWHRPDWWKNRLE